MYIKKIEIENIRNIKHFVWEPSEDQLAGWHVLIGDNGSGKSTILKAVSLALIGGYEANALRQDWTSWPSYQSDEGNIVLSIALDQNVDRIRGQQMFFPPPDELSINITRQRGLSYEDVPRPNDDRSKTDYVGWFSAAYGPFRRFSGGETRRKFSHLPARTQAHHSVFGEEIALTDALEWLQELRFRELEHDPKATILGRIREFVNQEGFLPHGVRLAQVSSDGVFFEDGPDTLVPVELLGDGYRSILSMVFDVIRQMQIAYGTDDLFSEDSRKIIYPGVVLIDEIDAHLHPEWQRRIGFWLTEHFPNMQFIVTTHSPLVCQAAINGSIWRLPTPGSGESSYQVAPDSEEWKRLVYGNVLEAYSTDLFGENIDRSPAAQDKYQRLAALSAKQLDEGLSDEEEDELDALMEELPQTPYKFTSRGQA